MKRYLVFAGEIYYPGGGAYEFKSSHDEFWEARFESDRLMVDDEHDWAHVFDAELEDLVYEAGPYVRDGETEKSAGYGASFTPVRPWSLCDA